MLDISFKLFFWYWYRQYKDILWRTFGPGRKIRIDFLVGPVMIGQEVIVLN